MQGRIQAILGIDAGTTSVKTVAFALDGTILADAKSSVRIHRDDDGRAEVDMTLVWQAAAATITEVVHELGDTDVIAIGVTGQGDGAWLVDSNLHPMRPAALWLDGRANARLADWLEDGRAATVNDITGSPLFAGALPLLVDELQETGALDNDRLGYHLNCKDWLRWNLTGIVATDPSEASRTYLDTAVGAYSDELLRALSHERLRNALPPVQPPESVGGTLLPQVAEQLGLPAGIPVAIGLVDTAAAGVGLGAIGDGQGYAILGTTGFIGVNHPSRTEVRTRESIVLFTGRGGQVLESMAPMTGTPNLDWVRDTLGLTHEHWAAVELQADVVPPGSGGVIYLPYGAPSGERAPFFDPAASAGWLGMSITTTPAQLLRSVYEGLAYALTECLDMLGLDGDLLVCGGGSESNLLCSVLADVSGRSIVRQQAPEVGARGAATLALLAGEHASSLEDAVHMLAPASSTFTPSRERAEIYRDAYTTFIETRDALRPVWPQLRALRERSTALAVSTEYPKSEPPRPAPSHPTRSTHVHQGGSL
ncbi:FGGY family carbohydrate kinase [Pseudoclavibacter sp. Z016]|uniref:FGGY family carbohydrate kinase n=1 Tax=Pseudoclavibacter sp. Z016 TaxID=2080581 RepID=UPI000CE89390|nr:FGGY family carbohydrate kinase [Pseudoclavibacter sp. Z016]PPF73446.1 carbohydrate kinase [Pseudoclavibacter sp. Z016]